ncbi:hypothetical protein LTR17_005324 [Elasticomyces elasticus]|nr:hypothetical protein LTR17_005324 [Elasticomyces elasticus]
MTKKKIAFSGGASAAAAGYPVDVAVELEFETQLDFGAVLHCPKAIVEEGFYHRDPFRQWAQKNATAILQAQPDARHREVFVVTNTYSTSDAWVTAWSGKHNTVKMGFKVGIELAGEIGPSGEFVSVSSTEGWNHDVLDASVGRLVVFFSAVKLKYRYLPFGKASVRITSSPSRR